jgi:hypothetical protein
MTAQFRPAHEPIPSVEVYIQEQMFRAAVRTLGNDPKKEATVDLGGAGNDLIVPFMGRPRMLNLKRIAPTGAFHMSSVLMLLGFRRLRHGAIYKVPRTWDHRHTPIFRCERQLYRSEAIPHDSL